jgi:hypothetical protein
LHKKLLNGVDERDKRFLKLAQRSPSVSTPCSIFADCPKKEENFFSFASLSRSSEMIKGGEAGGEKRFMMRICCFFGEALVQQRSWILSVTCEVSKFSDRR